MKCIDMWWYNTKKPPKYFVNYINPLCSYIKFLGSWTQRNFIILLYVVFGSLIVMSFITLFCVMFSDYIEIMFLDSMTIQKLLGTQDKKETIQFIGFGISGLIGFIAVISLTRRANALEKQNKLVEKGHAQDRFKLAINHLGDVNNPTIRTASFYELYNLARDNEYLRQDIFEILCAHLRKTTRNKDYQENKAKNEPTEEVQNLLDVLFNKQENTFGSLSANLQKVYLVGANLYQAHLKNAILSEARLEHVQFQNAHLEDAILEDANLENANLDNANLDNAILKNTNLERAVLIQTHLKGAYLMSTNLKHADLFWAKLNEAWLDNANLENASIGRADLHKADISDETKMPEHWERDVRRMPDGTINEPRSGSYT